MTPKPDTPAPFTVTLYAECAICAEHASEDSQCYTLDDLRMSPDDEPYCLNCWDELPDDAGPWAQAETLEHRLNRSSAEALAAENARLREALKECERIASCPRVGPLVAIMSEALDDMKRIANRARAVLSAILGEKK